MQSTLQKFFAALGAVGVCLGAFGAHALKATVSAPDLDVWKTATTYLFVHVLAGMYSSQYLKRTRASWFFLAGILLFAGSLYTLVLTQVRMLGAVAPVGGVLFILGWILTVIDTRTMPAD